MNITTVESLYQALNERMESSGISKKELIAEIGTSQQGFYASYKNMSFRFPVILQLIELLNGSLQLYWPYEQKQAEPRMTVQDTDLLYKYIDSLESRIKDKDRLIEALYNQIDTLKA